ncbi:hypothetical protein A6R68_15454, partial [Neotoma lepida]
MVCLAREQVRHEAVLQPRLLQIPGVGFTGFESHSPAATSIKSLKKGSKGNKRHQGISQSVRSPLVLGRYSEQNKKKPKEASWPFPMPITRPSFASLPLEQLHDGRTGLWVGVALILDAITGTSAETPASRMALCMESGMEVAVLQLDLE